MYRLTRVVFLIIMLPSFAFAQQFFNFGNKNTQQPAATAPAGMPKPVAVTSPQDYKSAVNKISRQSQQMIVGQLKQDLANAPQPPPPTNQITPPPNAPGAVQNPPPSIPQGAPQTATPVLNNSNTTSNAAPAPPPAAANQPLQNVTPPSSVLVNPGPRQQEVYTGFTGTTNKSTAPANTNQPRSGWNINY